MKSECYRQQRNKCSQVQKRSQYIGKTVHVTSVAQPQFCDAMRILFFHKGNKNNNLLNHSSPPSYIFHHFREYHNAYAGFCLSVNNAYYAAFVHARAFPPNVNNADYIKYILKYSPKWRTTQLEGEEWLSKLFLKTEVEPLMSHGLFYRCIDYVSGPGNTSVALLSMEGQRAL